MKNILKKLLSIQQDITRMEKDGRNTFQNYKYLSETQITLKMKELLDKHGVIFFHSSHIKGSYEISPTKSGTKQFVTDVEIGYKFYDVDSGEFLEGTAMGQGADSQDKGIYKAITGAVKYVFMKNFLIPTGDDPEKDEIKHAEQVFNGTSDPIVVKPKIGPTDRQAELYRLLIEYNDGDKDDDAIKELLKKFTVFQGDKGEVFCDSFKKMKGKWLEKTIQKVNEAIALKKDF